MPHVGTKKIKEINFLSVFEKVLINHGYTFLQGGGPDDWDKSYRDLFDIVTEIEDELKVKIINLLTGKTEVAKKPCDYTKTLDWLFDEIFNLNGAVIARRIRTEMEKRLKENIVKKEFNITGKI